MIVLERKPKINKVPEYNGQKYGKIQISAAALARYIGQNVYVMIYVAETDEDNLKLSGAVGY